MFKSNIVPTQKVELPLFQKGHLYMHPVELDQKANLPEEFKVYNAIAQSMIDASPIKKGTAWITIDNKFISVGRTHRRGGPHVDGNYNYDWGGTSDWKTGGPGRSLPQDKHLEQYGSEKGGMLIVSSYPACKAWKGEYNTLANQGGDCSHIVEELNNMEAIVLEPNTIYLANSTCVHESIPLHEDVSRSLLRLTLPNTDKVL